MEAINYELYELKVTYLYPHSLTVEYVKDAHHYQLKNILYTWTDCIELNSVAWVRERTIVSERQRRS
jgi:hypothetical protein